MKKLFLLLGIIPMLVIVFLVQPKAQYLDHNVDYIFAITQQEVVKDREYEYLGTRYDMFYSDKLVIQESSGYLFSELYSYLRWLSNQAFSTNYNNYYMLVDGTGIPRQIAYILVYYTKSTESAFMQFYSPDINFRYDINNVTDNLPFENMSFITKQNPFNQQILDNAYNQGYNTGLDVGYDMGYPIGYDIGYDNGYDTGYLIGLDEGPEEAYEEGYTKGYNDRFASGLEKWIVPAIIIVLVGGGFLSIMALKRRD